MTLTRITLALAFLIYCISIAEAQSPDADRGRKFAETTCAPCHSIGKSGQSPLPKAPPFRELHQRYPLEDLEESLAEGIVTGHPSMPLV
jgi:cytochrome c